MPRFRPTLPSAPAGLIAVALGCVVSGSLRGAETELRISVYATAGDVQRYLAADDQRWKVVEACRRLDVSRVFLEGRRGDEYVSPDALAAARDFLRSHDIDSAGGIATVPGERFGTRQNEALGWLNWESEQTRQDVAGFFRENAPLFRQLIVDDFFCTADTSPLSAQARGARSWPDYRRDLLVSLIEPLMTQPTRMASPSTQRILKFPQWYDRFHLFGYDPPRMASSFDQIWVGTEVRNPMTRRMGYVQPTEGYMNFRWITSIAGEKVVGAWFDHIECTARNFVDQAYLSVLAGARELTLFRLGDVMEGHPGDVWLAERLPELRRLAARVHERPPRGIAFYKPPGSDAHDNLYLADYLGMLGLPILPVARYPTTANVAVLPAQAAADPDILPRMKQHLRAGATLVLTPAFLRQMSPSVAELAGVEVSPALQPGTLDRIQLGRDEFPLATPLEVDLGLRADRCRVLARGTSGDRSVPWLTRRRSGGGRVLVWNVRTFDEQDFRETGEWLLAPKPLGVVALPQSLADALRGVLLEPLRVQLNAPAGVSLFLLGENPVLYSFLEGPVRIRLGNRDHEFEGLSP